MSTLIRDGGRSLWPNIQRGACLLALSALSACASRMDGAPVVDRTGQAPGMATLAPSDQPPGPPPPGFYRVKPGDTLYRVALLNGQNYRDITVWNNLANPNQIEVGQLLRVAPPGADVSNSGAMVTTTPLGSMGSGSTMPTGQINGPSGSNYPSPYAAPSASVPGGAPTGYPSPYAPGTPNVSGSPGPSATAGDAMALGPQSAQSSGQGAYAIPSPYASSAMASAPSNPAVNTTPPVASGPVSFIWPVRGQIIRKYNGTTSKGVDIAGTAGTPIMAAAAGRVLYAGNSLRGYGNLIIIKHDNTFLTAYGHNRTLLVKENDAVQKGQTIAEMGDTQADRVMLHFEVRQDTKPVDPLKFLPPQ